MKFNNKGMTLIELLVAIVVLSIACLMSATGVTAIISRMSEGAEIKKATNTIVSAIDGDSSSTDYQDVLNVKTGRAQLKLDDGTTLVANGTMYEGKIVYGSGDNDSVNLSRYSAQEIVMTDNEKKAYTMYTLINNPPLTIDWYNSLSKEDKEKIVEETGLYPSNTPNIAFGDKFNNRNESFMRYVALTYYYKIDASGKRITNWPLLDTSKMYFINPNSPEVHVDITINQDLYILPFFPNGGGSGPAGSNTFGLNILYARVSNSYDSGWNTSFVFNDLDNHWYYKKGGLNMTLFNADSKEDAEKKLKELKQNMINQKDNWYRVYEE